MGRFLSFATGRIRPEAVAQQYDGQAEIQLSRATNFTDVSCDSFLLQQAPYHSPKAECRSRA